MSNTMELLLKCNFADLPVGTFKLKRLSKEVGEDVLFSLTALRYDRVQEIRDGNSTDIDIHILLAGVTEPNLKSSELMAHYGAATPVDMIKKMLLPGEIEDLSRQIEKLSGYRSVTIEQIKKK